MTAQNDRADVHYAGPVGRLLEIGEPAPDRRGSKPGDEADWLDYVARFGIGAEHVDDLIRMACDPALNEGSQEGATLWAPVHAWRALGQLRAAPAAAPLLELAQTEELDDWIGNDLPTVLGMIGRPAIGPIADFLADPVKSGTAGGTAFAGLTAIAQHDPECRAECISVIERTLRHDRADMDFNASAVAAVLDLKAVEAIDAVRDAFRRNAVDFSMAGDVEDVEIALGLRKQRQTWRPRPNSPQGKSLERLRSLAQTRLATTPAEKRKKVGRNDPCPCGSGRKYKKCCGSSTNDGPAPM